MKRRLFALLFVSTAALSMIALPEASAAGRGGGGGRGGMGGGGFRPSGGMGGGTRGGFSGGGFNASGFSGGARSDFQGLRPDMGGLRGADANRGFDGSRGVDRAGSFDGDRNLDRSGDRFDDRGPASSRDVSDFLGLPREDGGAVQRNPLAGDANRWSTGYAGNRAAWADLGGDRFDRIQDNINNVVRPGDQSAAKIHNWTDNHPDRVQDWKQTGDQVRDQWNHDRRPGSDWWSKDHRDDHHQDWWSKNHPNLNPWYYHHNWHHHDWHYWWGYTPWNNLAPWFTGWGWAQPVFYDYGTGGNVVYQDNSVYVDGQNVGSADDYAASAAELATVDPSTQSSDGNDWLPLGTFAIVTSESNPDTNRQLQLAVDKQGVVSGTMHNTTTGKSYVVQGRVDKQTQRVAFTIGDNSDVVIETGIYNLTKDETPVLVHYGKSRTEKYLLVRLKSPPADGNDLGDSQVDPLTESDGAAELP